MLTGQKYWYIFSLLLLILLAGCGAGQSNHVVQMQPITADSLNIAQHPTPTISITIPKQIATVINTPPNQTNTNGAPPTTVSGTVNGPAPYGPPPPMTTEEYQLTQQLFALINHDRAVRGLYPFVWNATLAGGARLHSWNMVHCGFSHTCPDGLTNACALPMKVSPDLRIAASALALLAHPHHHGITYMQCKRV